MFGFPADSIFEVTTLGSNPIGRTLATVQVGPAGDAPVPSVQVDAGATLASVP